jgi:hypothetical protein
MMYGRGESHEVEPRAGRVIGVVFEMLHFYGIRYLRTYKIYNG